MNTENKFLVAAVIALLVVVFIILGVNLLNSSTSVGPTTSSDIMGQDIPVPTGYIVDYAGILDEKTVETLTEKLIAFAKGDNGEIAVLTVNSMNGLSIEEFGIRVMEKWAVGKSGKDNGEIIIVSKGDREVRIETGRGSVITDAQAGEILKTVMVPKLKAGDWAGAISDGIDELIKLTNK